MPRLFVKSSDLVSLFIAIRWRPAHGAALRHRLGRSQAGRHFAVVVHETPEPLPLEFTEEQAGFVVVERNGQRVFRSISWAFHGAAARPSASGKARRASV